MQVLEKVSLAGYSTMALGGTAAYLVEVSTPQEVEEAYLWASSKGLPCLMVGSGSNIIWKDEGFIGLVIVNSIHGYSVFDEDGTNIYITVGAGEPWDSVVERSVKSGLTGIEALSLIPGKAGATPIQNVGAYGQEIAESLTTIEAYDTTTKSFITIPKADCGFGYRTSRFKTTDRGRFFIISITLHLVKGELQPPYYSSVEGYFEANNMTDHSPAAVRQAVISIRDSKLPNPALVHNVGSFFGNPIISENQFINLSSNYENMPHWPASEDRIKLSAAWLIEQAGFKNYRDTNTGMAIWPKQSLVLVNERAQTTADLLAFKKMIVDAIKEKFQITLQQEPELLP